MAATWRTSRNQKVKPFAVSTRTVQLNTGRRKGRPHPTHRKRSRMSTDATRR